MNPTRIELSLPATAEAPRLTRRAVAERPELADPDLRFVLNLLLTELVTNAVRHAGLDPGDRIELRIVVDDDVVSVRVTDHGRGTRALPSVPEDERESGRGLLLVTAIAERWGVEVSAGTSVWFELDCEPSGRPRNLDAVLRRAAESSR
jgi:anti-sigma regulatory factor (Ser/Thr protein kinase)